MRVRTQLLLLVILASTMAALAGCKGCGPDGGQAKTGLLERVPKGVLAVVHVPRSQTLLEQIGATYGRLESTFPDLKRMVGDASARLGFDPLKPETMETIGLDPARPLLVAAHKNWLLIGLSVADAKVFDGYLRARFEREMPGALEFRAAKVGQRDATLVLPKGKEGATPVFAYVFDRGQALVVPSQAPEDSKPVDPLAILGELLEPAKGSRLIDDPSFASLQRTVETGAGVTVWLDTVPLAQEAAAEARKRGSNDEARVLEGIQKALLGLSLGLKLSDEGITLKGKGLVEPKQYAMMKQHFATKAGSPGFARLVGSDAVLYFGGAFEPKRAFRFLRGFLPKGEREKLEAKLAEGKAAGLDLEADVLAALTGNLAFAFHRVDLSGGLPKLLSGAKGVNPAVVDTATYVEFTDATKAKALMGQVKAGLMLQGLAIEDSTLAGGVQRATVKKGELPMASWLLKDRTLAIATGASRADRLAEALQGKGASLDSVVTDAAARQVISGKSELGLYISVRNLVANFPILVLLLPQAAPTLNALSDLYLDLHVVSDGVEGELALRFKPVAKPAQP